MLFCSIFTVSWYEVNPNLTLDKTDFTELKLLKKLESIFEKSKSFSLANSESVLAKANFLNLVFKIRERTGNTVETLTE